MYLLLWLMCFNFSKKPITESEDSWDVQYPGSVMQFLCLVHSNFPRDALWASSDFLNSLASAVFPPEMTEVRHKDLSSFFAPLIKTMHSGNVTEPVNGLIYFLYTQNAAGPQSNEDAVDTSAPRLSHPARKQVCDFIRILLMDSLINILAKDQTHPFIQLLEVSRDTHRSYA